LTTQEVTRGGFGVILGENIKVNIFDEMAAQCVPEHILALNMMKSVSKWGKILVF